MRNKSFATLGALALLAAASAFGQQHLKADIPFEFSVGNRVMPAGQYDVEQTYQGKENLLFVGCYKCEARVLVLSHKAVGDRERTKDSLVFNKYGGTYFLSSVWIGGRGDGSALPESKTEHEIARSASLALTSYVVLARR